MRRLVLMYHRVNTLRPDPWTTCVSPKHFAEHLQVLRSLPNAPEVTFDDGYADNFEHAKPLLEKYEVPATIFVVSGAVGSPYEMWWDELDREYLGSTHPDWDWDDEPTDIGAAQYKAEYLRCRERPFDVFERRLEARPERRTMSADEVAEIATGGLVSIGAHTISHPVLSQLTLEEQQREILGSKYELKEITGREVIKFAYPNGYPSDYTADTVRICREAGFECAYAAWDAPLFEPCDPFQIPRMMVRDWDGDQFAALLQRRLNT